MIGLLFAITCSSLALGDQDCAVSLDLPEEGPLLLLQTQEVSVEAREVPVRTATGPSGGDGRSNFSQDFPQTVSAAVAAAVVGRSLGPAGSAFHGQNSSDGLGAALLERVAEVAEADAEAGHVIGKTLSALMTFGVTVALIVCAGLMSGLGLSLLGLRRTDIQDSELQQLGRSMSNVLADRHLLMVTLLLCKEICDETLPLVLNAKLGAFPAAIISIVGLLIGGEILPQAVFSACSTVTLCSFTPMVRVLMWITWPLAVPMARVLDFVFDNTGADITAALPRQAMSSLMQLQHQKGILTKQEVSILEGAMGLACKKVDCCMTRIKDVHSIRENAPVDKTLLDCIVSYSRSRVPVHSAHDRAILVGIVDCRSLVSVHPKDSYGVRDLARDELLHVSQDTSLADMLSMMQGGPARMAAVYNRDAERIGAGKTPPGIPALGIVTMNDVVQELLMSEIKDESSVRRVPSRTRSNPPAVRGPYSLPK